MTQPRTLAQIASGIDQVGIVVRDFDVVEEGMRRLFGLEPRSRSENSLHGHAYDGRTIDPTVGMMFYDLFGIELEFLSPRPSEKGEPNVWQDFLDEHGEGLHHLRLTVDDQVEVREFFGGLDIGVKQSGDSVRGNGIMYSYFDTTPLLGFFLETFNPGGTPKK